MHHAYLLIIQSHLALPLHLALRGVHPHLQMSYLHVEQLLVGKDCDILHGPAQVCHQQLLGPHVCPELSLALLHLKLHLPLGVHVHLVPHPSRVVNDILHPSHMYSNLHFQQEDALVYQNQTHYEVYFPHPLTPFLLCTHILHVNLVNLGLQHPRDCAVLGLVLHHEQLAVQLVLQLPLLSPGPLPDIEGWLQDPTISIVIVLRVSFYKDIGTCSLNSMALST